jgi:hypothetical protein
MTEDIAKIAQVKVSPTHPAMGEPLDVRLYTFLELDRAPWSEARASLVIESSGGWGLRVYPTVAECRALAAAFTKAAEVIADHETVQLKGDVL